MAAQRMEQHETDSRALNSYLAKLTPNPNIPDPHLTAFELSKVRTIAANMECQ